jgi:hypothetical protein
LWQTYQEKITKTQALLTAYRSLADERELLGQCTNMAQFKDICDFFNLHTYEDIETRVATVKIGYAVAQALDTAGVPFHKDFKGTFPSLHHWNKMTLPELHKEIDKAGLQKNAENFSMLF